MSRCEVIHMISDLASVKNKTAENHFDYLVREKRLPELKVFGRTVVAQPTTTDRCMITVSQQQRWNTANESRVISGIKR